MAFTPSASAFSLPLPSWQQPTSVRVAKYEPKKRKKGANDWGDDDDDDDYDGETTDAASEVATSAPSLTLSPEEAHQYRVAGLSFDKELPGGNFPHGPPKDEHFSSQTKQETLVKELSSLSSPIYPPKSAAHHGNLRVQHLAVLSSILHRCLLERDFVRAGRAWGLILREQYRGNPMDVRTEGRWGIGAEILLRQGCQPADDTSESGTPRLWFTRKGFEDAKEYYERLVIQYPYRKAAPSATSSLHFYIAMFGLWVYVIQEESSVARQATEPEETMSIDEEDSGSGSDGHTGSKQRRQTLVAEARQTELDGAQKIAARMDEVLVSPPYSDSVALLELRGMISQWIADLFVSSVPHDENDDYSDDDDSDDMPADSSAEDIQTRRDLRIANDKRRSEIQKATEFLEKAKARGKGMMSGLQELHI